MISPQKAGVLRVFMREWVLFWLVSLQLTTQVICRKKTRIWPFSKVKWKWHFVSFSFSLALSYRWILNDFPSFVQPDGGRWFVSQVTGNLYLANARVNDTGNYFCLTTINMDITTKSTFSKAIQLTVQSDSQYHFSALTAQVSLLIIDFTQTIL